MTVLAPSRREYEIRVNPATELPHHGFRQADGSFVLCPRNASLCVPCKENGVPYVSEDRFEQLKRLISQNWGRPWTVRSQYASKRKGVVTDGHGIHMIAKDPDTRDIHVLFSLADPADHMVILSAIAAVHNEKTGWGN